MQHPVVELPPEKISSDPALETAVSERKRLDLGFTFDQVSDGENALRKRTLGGYTLSQVNDPSAPLPLHLQVGERGLHWFDAAPVEHSKVVSLFKQYGDKYRQQVHGTPDGFIAHTYKDSPKVTLNRYAIVEFDKDTGRAQVTDDDKTGLGKEIRDAQKKGLRLAGWLFKTEPEVNAEGKEEFRFKSLTPVLVNKDGEFGMDPLKSGRFSTPLFMGKDGKAYDYAENAVAGTDPRGHLAWNPETPMLPRPVSREEIEAGAEKWKRSKLFVNKAEAPDPLHVQSSNVKAKQVPHFQTRKEYEATKWHVRSYESRLNDLLPPVPPEVAPGVGEEGGISPQNTIPAPKQGRVAALRRQLGGFVVGAAAGAAALYTGEHGPRETVEAVKDAAAGVVNGAMNLRVGGYTLGEYSSSTVNGLTKEQWEIEAARRGMEGNVTYSTRYPVALEVFVKENAEELTAIAKKRLRTPDVGDSAYSEDSAYSRGMMSMLKKYEDTHGPLLIESVGEKTPKKVDFPVLKAEWDKLPAEVKDAVLKGVTITVTTDGNEEKINSNEFLSNQQKFTDETWSVKHIKIMSSVGRFPLGGEFLKNLQAISPERIAQLELHSSNSSEVRTFDELVEGILGWTAFPQPYKTIPEEPSKNGKVQPNATPTVRVEEAQLKERAAGASAVGTPR